MSHIIGDKRVVSGADTVLHRQIQAGGGFPAARNAEEDHLGLIEITQRNSVIVGKGVVDSGDTRVVFVQVTGRQAVGAVSDWRRIEAQLLLQGATSAWTIS
ncbi:Uncharacterised protein [Klebsiella michiganensis]|uniref:Uncharacterized protein n=1 Tax=Klebsiella michiganensis TaxID=1134687 RepID=A0A7H4PL34_9ENTR|nr:Uncharacterised protein [Klebsiella michiganensis]